MSKRSTICAGSQEEPLAEADVEARDSQAPSGPHFINLNFCRHTWIFGGWGFLPFFFLFF